MSAGQLLRDAGISRVSGMNEEDKCLESLLKPTKCVCGDPSDTNVVHRSDAPCYYKSQPAQPDPRGEAKPCERCAELEAENYAWENGGYVNLWKMRTEDRDKTIEQQRILLLDLREKLAALEAEKEEIKQAIRWAPSSAHWSNVLIKLCGEDSRDGINALEKQLREAQATIAQQAEQLAAAQKAADRVEGLQMIGACAGRSDLQTERSA